MSFPGFKSKIKKQPWRKSVVLFSGALMLGIMGLGCAKRPEPRITGNYYRGETGLTRAYLEDKKTDEKDDRNYLLDRVRLGMSAMADGYPSQAEEAFDEAYQVLRTQGINEDKTVASVVINEDLKFWKGEPFEQALALYYISLLSAMQNDWGNARAASDNALFRLKRFGTDELSQEDMVKRAARSESSLRRYKAVESDFTLAYLMNGIANQQMGRKQEAWEKYAIAEQLNPELKNLIIYLKEGDYNAIFFLDYGRGPQKIGTGPDNAIAEFRPLIRSDHAGVRLAVNNDLIPFEFPQVADINRMASNHMWNNLEDVRIAKSVVGSVLLTGGAAALGYAVAEESWEAAAVGAVLIGSGAFLKAGAHADTTYNEMNPQRIYIVPAKINKPDSVVAFMVDGRPNSTIALSNLQPPKRGELMVRYVPMLTGNVRSLPSFQGSANPLAALELIGREENAGPDMSSARREGDASYNNFWTSSTKIFYGNDRTGPTQTGVNLPYILGGHDLRTPTREVLRSYQASGYLKGWTLDQLRDLYRAERIILPEMRGADNPGKHIVDGGNSINTPILGSIGFKRLYQRQHRPYRPKSEQLKKARSEVRLIRSDQKRNEQRNNQLNPWHNDPEFMRE